MNVRSASVKSLLHDVVPAAWPWPAPVCSAVTFSAAMLLARKCALALVSSQSAAAALRSQKPPNAWRLRRLLAGTRPSPEAPYGAFVYAVAWMSFCHVEIKWPLFGDSMKEQ